MYSQENSLRTQLPNITQHFISPEEKREAVVETSTLSFV